MQRFLFTQVLAVLVIAACGREEAADGTGGGPEGDLEPGTPSFGIYNTLKATGNEVSVVGEAERPFFSPTGHRLEVNGASVEVYEFDTPEETQEAATRIQTNGNVVGMAEWGKRVYFYKTDRVIVFYPGSDPTVKGALDVAIGAPFAGG
jgi:hypothetical protein